MLRQHQSTSERKSKLPSNLAELMRAFTATELRVEENRGMRQPPGCRIWAKLRPAGDALELRAPVMALPRAVSIFPGPRREDRKTSTPAMNSSALQYATAVEVRRFTFL